MRTIRAVIIDDETANIEHLQLLLSKHCSHVLVIGTADSVEKGVVLVSQLQPDLLFLDIQMGKQNGFDLLNQLTERNFDVIFVTAFDKYGIKAIKFSALDYLLKPVDVEELILAVNKAGQKTSAQQLDFLLNVIRKNDWQSPRIALPLQQEIRYVQVQDIVRCEAENTYTFFYLKDGQQILVSRPLKEYAQLLSPYNFIRTHQSHLVNPVFVKSWVKEEGGYLLLENGAQVPVARNKKEDVKRGLM